MCRRENIKEKIGKNVVASLLGFTINGVQDPCYIWQGSHSGNGRGGGYPRMSLDGQTVAVHIVSFVNEFGFVPGKKQIDHLCNNRMCVNPAHLEMVTHRQNQKRRSARTKKENLNVKIQLIEIQMVENNFAGSDNPDPQHHEGRESQA